MSGKGTLIVFEGPSRSGKSSLARGLKRWLEEHGVPVTWTEWNSYPPVMALINQKKAEGSFTPLSYSLLHLTDFALRYEAVISPALTRGEVVIADRWVYTALTRDVARGISTEYVQQGYGFARKPDMAFYVAIEAEAALARRRVTKKYASYNSGVDIWPDLPPEEAFLRYHQRLSDLYQPLVQTEPFLCLDGQEGTEQNLQRICLVVGQRLGLDGVMQTGGNRSSQNGGGTV